MGKGNLGAADNVERRAVGLQSTDRFRGVTLTCSSLISLSMSVTMKSLARAKFVEPILSELSTMKARSKGAHLHSAHT